MEHTTSCFCKKCRNELTTSNSFISDDGDIVTYRCSGCGAESKFSFNAPVPILMSCN